MHNAERRDIMRIRTELINQSEQLIPELPWDTVELIVREALKDDIELVQHVDNELLEALKVVYQYYGGLLETT